MAVKQLINKKKIEALRAELKPLEERTDEIVKTREALEEDLEKGAEGTEDLTDEQLDVIEKEDADLEAELTEKNEKIKTLTEKISELEAENEALNAKNTEDKEETADKNNTEENTENKRGTDKMGELQVKSGFFKDMARDTVRALVAREEIKTFAARIREFKGQERAVKGAELGIPEILIGMLKDNMHRYSKLIKHVNLKPIKGKARTLVAGTVPEAVWTEMCANLNELAINFNLVEVDGYKVGGFIAVCDALLEDTDINLVNEIMDMLGQAIGLAIDKAILYGKGVKMPVGIATRLAETAKPAYWGTHEISWTNLSETNIRTLSGNGVELYKAIFKAIGGMKSNYSNGDKFFAMNETTYRTLQMEGLAINVNGTLVSAVEGQNMPLMGGTIEFFDFIPVGDVIGGYGSLYLLAEREGTVIESSSHARFLNDQTVFKGSARYDGRPVRGEGFVLFNINNTAPTTTMTFAADTANV